MEGYCMLYADYFSDDPLHHDVIFRHRFSTSRKLFLRIVENLREINYFKLNRDDFGFLDFSTILKFTIALQILAYSMLGDTQDDCMRWSSPLPSIALYTQ
jgi:hypothetical protein